MVTGQLTSHGKRTASLAALAPAAALRVIETLEAAGYDAWIVGGWVRDALRGEQCHDVDITTSALWEDSARAMRAAGLDVEETGTAHGTVTAMVAGEPIEVTTYRVEGAYSDHRHPDEVRFVTDACEDLARRDLTINAMAWHPTRGLLDPFGGLGDLERGVVRAVGNADVRFGEDALRVLRAVRFALRFGFEVEPGTRGALLAHAHDLVGIAPERMGKEVASIVRLGKAGRALLDYPEVMCAAIPELAQSRGFEQKSVYHVYDVYDHIAHVCCAVEAFTAGMATEELRWAALLHDVAKPATFSEDVEGHGHFFGHPAEGARMAKCIMRRLALPREVVDRAYELIRLHDQPMAATPQAMRLMLRDLSSRCAGHETELGFSLFSLRRADAVAKCPSAAAWASSVDRYAQLLREEVRRGPVFLTRHLAVNGADVMRACGMHAGPGVGMQLDMLLAAVMAGDVPNERSALLTWLKGPQ